MTASWSRQNVSEKTIGSKKSCGYFEEWDESGTDQALTNGVYNCDDLKEFGKKNGWCPYFVARHAITMADVVVYNYQYMLDPKVAGLISQEMNENSVVIFDEGHNIDNICIEALSVDLDINKLNKAQACITKLNNRVNELRSQDVDRIRSEYTKLVSNLRISGALPQPSATDDQLGAAPIIPNHIADDAVPGSIRRAEHFLRMLRIIIQYLKNRLNSEEHANNTTTNNINRGISQRRNQQARVEVESPSAFLLDLEQKTALDREPLKYFYSRLHSLMRTVAMVDLDEAAALGQLANFLTLAATYHVEHNDGFAVIFDPFFRGPSSIPEPKLQFSCLDASLAIQPVFTKFLSVIITSGTLSPLDLYPTLLGFQPAVSKSFAMSIFRTCILPLVVSKGADQQAISTRFEARDNISIIRNYGILLIELVSSVPDGIVTFFTSYQYMEKTIAHWDEMGIIRQLLAHKLIFIETKDVVETSIAYDNYKRACNIGRGAIFFSIARGKVAEGIDFKGHYGRCVVCIGVPYQYTQSHVLRTRLEYLLTKHQIREADFLTFDAMRQTAQCIGRVIRSKKDYGIVILADARFAKNDKRDKLPGWVLQFLNEFNVSITTEEALSTIGRFLRQMGQPFSQQDLDSIQLDPIAAIEIIKTHLVQSNKNKNLLHSNTKTATTQHSFSENNHLATQDDDGIPPDDYVDNEDVKMEEDDLSMSGL
eukprot:CAMPEP_0197320100 /NCGR_PEP_ID=MMETSP0891-20130614/57627_1 /TAXON_ID=44058 ORGANISM="Aureoumbra lagunensis, Strain CCMP1510" /NCGR_SAMPLE_ID=MMETSP0891 /ASSEMBLY_ACC=CAM_ASM_000534 /LENGTH=708 /DNA_ID=CAMNT_0042811325 /DNA_START=520 /DNA_END=2646 /DNA_ORIENTATION=+